MPSLCVFNVILVAIGLMTHDAIASPAERTQETCPADLDAQTLCRAIMDRFGKIDEELVVGDILNTGCPKEFPWKMGNKCFLFSHNLMTCDNAAEECTELGGQLAEPRSEEMHDFLTAVAQIHHSVQGYWLGGTATPVPGQWAWRSDNTTFNYTAWADGRPSNSPHRPNGHDNCLEMRRGANYQWNDYHGVNDNNFICQMQLEES